MPYTYTTPEGAPVTDGQLEDQFADSIDDAFGDVVIAGHVFPSARALRILDETAYRCEYANWLDSMIDNGEILEGN